MGDNIKHEQKSKLKPQIREQEALRHDKSHKGVIIKPFACLSLYRTNHFIYSATMEPSISTQYKHAYIIHLYLIHAYRNF